VKWQEYEIAMRGSSVTGKEKSMRYLGILIIHALPIIALAQGTATQDWLLFALIWPIQLIGSTLALHRYFAHRAFRTSRIFQFILALSSSLAFGDPIGFTGKHRLHHKFADKKNDVHSPRDGLWSCWIGSLVDFGYSEQDVRRHSADLCRYPELVWLHEYKRVPGLALALILFFVGGFTSVAIGFALGVVSIIHLGSAVNYFCHGRGKRRFETNDNSTNNWVIAILSMGEGWHNNHHHYPRSAKAGFYWWEIDVMYWIICLFEKFGLVWDVCRPPQKVYDFALP